MTRLLDLLVTNVDLSKAERLIEFKKFTKKDQMKNALDSLIGVDLGGPTPLVVSAIGQADDVPQVLNNVAIIWTQKLFLHTRTIFVDLKKN